MELEIEWVNSIQELLKNVLWPLPDSSIWSIPPFYGAPPLGARLEGPTLLIPTCPSKKDVVGSFAECGKRGGAAGRAPPYPSQNGFRVLPPHIP